MKYNSPKILTIVVLSFAILIAIFLSGFLYFVEAIAQNKSNQIIVDNFEKPRGKNGIGSDFGVFSDNENLGSCYLFFFQNRKEGV
jgi:hypothetical protein